MKFALAKPLVLLVTSIALTACVNTSLSGLFSHYSFALHDTRSLVDEGKYQAALDAMPNAPFGPLLDSLERGRVAFLAGDLSTSESEWQKADDLIREMQSKAQIRVSEGFNQAGALLSNDNMLTYFPSDYELGFLHLYRALYFLQQQNLNAALVEIRRANQVQESARESRQDELNKAQQSIQQQGLTNNTNLGAVLARYPNIETELSRVQNGYLFFLSALLYEAERNLNSAFIDYSRALAVASGNKYIASALMRVSKRQGRIEELAQLEKKYGALRQPNAGQGQLVILIEEGVVKPKSGWRIPFLYQASYSQANLNFTLPYYAKSYTMAEQSSRQGINVSVAGKQIQFSLLTDVNAMAEKSLSEAIPAMATRQVLRMLAKSELVRAVGEKDKTGFGQLATGLYSMISEQPDTRSWQTLPKNVKVFSQYYLSGEIVVSLVGKALPINIQANKTTLLWVSRQGENFTYWQGILGEI